MERARSARSPSSGSIALRAHLVGDVQGVSVGGLAAGGLVPHDGVEEVLDVA